MSDWALASGFRSETFGATSGATTKGGTAVTGGAADTKGSWTQLAAATSFEATALLLAVNTFYSDTNYLLDIGIGGAGSERVVIPDVLVALANGTALNVLLPVAIPVGSRVAARCADRYGGSDIYPSVTLLGGGFVNPSPYQNVVAYGVVTSGSTGTTVDAGGSANSKGSWTQITSGTTRAHKGLMVAAVRPDFAIQLGASYYQLSDIGIGASGSEQILIPNLRYESNQGTGGISGGSPLLRGALEPAMITLPPCDIPAGSRLAIRQQSTTTDAQDRTCAYVVYGLG